LITEEQGQHQTTGSGAGKPGKGSTSEPEEVMMIEETWMQPYLAYMINKALPEDTVEAKYNGSVPTMHHSSRRTRNTKRHPHRSMWASR
jgi:hypothetical protein